MRGQDLEQCRKSVRTRSGDISYLDVGEGPVVLLVHGVGTNAYLWRNVLAALGGERRGIALDLPLHGATPARPDQDFSLAALAEQLEDFCDALGLTDIDLVAHDTGGAIAQIFAARHRSRLATFALTNCDTHDNVPPEAFKPTVELAARGELAPGAAALLADPAVARAAVFATGYEDPEQPSDEMVLAFLEPVLGTPERARTFERLLTSLRPDDLLAVEPELATLEVPTIVVWGDADPFFDVAWAYWLRDTIPGVRQVVVLAGAKLFFPDERADELLGHLRSHWAHAGALRS
jgi:pimeloyl-ACP methyl ester carboxylesterase